jgi:peptidoglycan-associated lipoprotein
MKQYSSISKLYILVVISILVNSCATSQDVSISEESPQVETGVLVESDGVISIAEDDVGTSASAFTDDEMTAQQMLDQTESILANRTIYFEFNSAKLSDETLSILEAHGAFIAENGNVEVRLEGHADERGSREYNIALGDRRAQSVRRVLLLQGASTDQVDTVSYGEEQPAVLGNTEETWTKNRRVELIYQVR